jgi:hypothetical protein
LLFLYLVRYGTVPRYLITGRYLVPYVWFLKLYYGTIVMMSSSSN